MINCEQHDHVEVACMFNYPVQLFMKSGEVIEGIALDTKLNDNKRECIKINQEGSDLLVELDEVTKMAVSVENPHFKEVTFT